VHLAAAAEPRHVGGDGAVHEGGALAGKGPLSVDPEVALEMKPPGRDLHSRTFTLAPVKTIPSQRKRKAREARKEKYPLRALRPLRSF